jgi:hypothetical protein
MKTKLPAIAPIAPTAPTQTLTPGQKALRAIVERQLEKKRKEKEDEQTNS